MSDQPDWAAQPPPYYPSPPGQAAASPGYGSAASAYGGPSHAGYAYQAYDGDGTVGQVRPTGISILLFVVTFGIYMYVYNYQVHSEMKRYSGRGVGGGIALLLTFLAGVAMPFVTPAEVGSLYATRGQRQPVNGWTGLWVVVPAVVGYIGWFVLIISLFATIGDNGNGGATTVAVGVVIGFIVLVAAAITCAVVWFVKTNGALNEFWQSLGAR